MCLHTVVFVTVLHTVVFVTVLHTVVFVTVLHTHCGVCHCVTHCGICHCVTLCGICHCVTHCGICHCVTHCGICHCVTHCGVCHCVTHCGICHCVTYCGICHCVTHCGICHCATYCGICQCYIFMVVNWHVSYIKQTLNIGVPAGSTSRGEDVMLCQGHKPTTLAHSFLLCSCACFCLYGPFNSIPFHKFSQQLFAFSFHSSGLNSALLVLSTIYLFMKVSLSPDVILCGWLSLQHQVSN